MELEHEYLEEKKHSLNKKRLIELYKELRFAFKKIRDRNGSSSGGSKWPLCIEQLMLEQIVNVNPPISIFNIIVSQVSLTMPCPEAKNYHVLGL